MTKIMKKIVSLFLIICLIFISTITCIGEIDVVKSYYLLKYEYKSFLDPLTNAGATESELIDFFKDIELLLKSHEDLSETTIHQYLKEALLKVATYREHRNLASIISGSYMEEIESYLDTGVVPPNLRDVYEAIIRALFGNEEEDKTELVKKYETYLNFYNSNKNDYTEQSVKVLKNSLENALAVLSNRKSTASDISGAVRVLDSAYDSLERKPTDSGNSSGDSSGSDSSGDQGDPSGGSTGAVVPIIPEPKSFSDVSQTYWGRSAIMYLAEKNIVNGFTDGTFRPDELVTREQFAKMLCETFKLSSASQLSVYTDVEAGAWYESYVLMITQSGLMQGIGNQTFGIGSTLIRQDLAVIADRITQQGLVAKSYVSSNQKVAFSDMSSVSDYAKSSVVKMQQYGIVNGTGENLFTPFGGVTRAQAAQIIYNLVK